MPIQLPATSLEEFLSKRNTETKNVLYNISVVNARLSAAIAKALNLQKVVIEDISEKINKISAINVEINSYKPNSVETPPKPKLLGKDAKDALRILESMKALGVTDIAGFEDKLKQAANNTQPSVLDSDIQLWSQKLTSLSESLSSKTQQETLRIQTFTGRYTQATDQSTNVTQKDGQSKNTIINNLR